MVSKGIVDSGHISLCYATFFINLSSIKLVGIDDINNYDRYLMIINILRKKF
jgi:hypothetical protein